MEAKDLMIGDWVRKGNLVGQVCDIEQRPKERIIGVGLLDYGYDFYEDIELEPIPLTPEILEKNGFRHGCYVGGYYSTDCPFRVFTKTTGTCEFTTLFDDEIYFSCVFVHQLQHAIRLCGIDKTIVL